MQKVFCRQFGVAEDSVVVQPVERPRPGPGEALVRMAYAPIDPADLLLLTGRHLVRPTLPAPVGIEGAGHVEALGDGVQGLAVGQPVALPYGGTWGEHVVLRVADLVPLPAGVDLRQASMLCVNPVTAAGLLDGLSPGTWIVQNAANSAVGKLVTRLARRRGLRQVAVVRRASLAAELLQLGADAVVVDGDDLPRQVSEKTGGAPVVRALDAVAGHASGRLFRCLADGGSLVTYGLLAADEVALPAADLVFRDITVRGYSRLRWLRTVPPPASAALFAELATMLAAGELDSEIEAVYPLGQVREAVAHAAREGRSGKILLRCGDT